MPHPARRAVCYIALPLAVVLSAGCASEAPRVQRTQSATTSPITPPRAEPVVTIDSLIAGDRGCYLQIRDVAGRPRTELAAFDLCEQPKLAGQRVRLVYETAPVMAASCQGDPACTRSDTVRLVRAATPVP